MAIPTFSSEKELMDAFEIVEKALWLACECLEDNGRSTVQEEVDSFIEQATEMIKEGKEAQTDDKRPNQDQGKDRDIVDTVPGN